MEDLEAYGHLSTVWEPLLTHLQSHLPPNTQPQEATNNTWSRLEPNHTKCSISSGGHHLRHRTPSEQSSTTSRKLSILRHCIVRAEPLLRVKPNERALQAMSHVNTCKLSLALWFPGHCSSLSETRLNPDACKPLVDIHHTHTNHG